MPLKSEAHTAAAAATASLASSNKHKTAPGTAKSRGNTAANARRGIGSRTGTRGTSRGGENRSRPGTSSSAAGAGGKRPGTAMSDTDNEFYDDDEGNGNVNSGATNNADDDIASVASQGGVSVFSLIEKVYSLAEFSTSLKRGLPRASTADKAKKDNATAAAGAPTVPAGYLALRGHPERKKYRYRDFYIRRMLEEQSCIRFIQFKYKLWAFWQRLRKEFPLVESPTAIV